MANRRTRGFLDGFVLARITETLVVDMDRVVKDVSDELSRAFPGKENAELAVGSSIRRLEEDGFIEVNDANNVVQDSPIDAFKEMSGQSVDSDEESGEGDKQ